MWNQIALGLLLVLVTTLVHAAATLVALTVLKRVSRLSLTHLWRVLRISGLVLGMFMVSVLDAVLWAYTYLAVGAIEGVEPALYFSMVTFTTLGYGDIALGDDWRLLASFEAANGIIMFGWTTALVVAYVQRLSGPQVDHTAR
jgi:hypothetical protein